MTKPDITLEPSQRVVSEIAARIYSAYIIRGDVKEGDEDKYMERSIRQAIRIAKTVERSIATEDEPPAAADTRAPHDEAPSPTTPATSRSEPVPTSSGEESEAGSDLESVIDEALSRKNVPTPKKKKAG